MPKFKHLKLVSTRDWDPSWVTLQELGQLDNFYEHPSHAWLLCSGWFEVWGRLWSPKHLPHSPSYVSLVIRIVSWRLQREITELPWFGYKKTQRFSSKFSNYSSTILVVWVFGKPDSQVLIWRHNFYFWKATFQFKRGSSLGLNCLKWATFVLLILMRSSQHSHQEWSTLSMHQRSSSVSAMRAMSSANLRRARINSPHFTPKPSFFIPSIRPGWTKWGKVPILSHPPRGQLDNFYQYPSHA